MTERDTMKWVELENLRAKDPAAAWRVELGSATRLLEVVIQGIEAQYPNAAGPDDLMEMKSIATRLGIACYDLIPNADRRIPQVFAYLKRDPDDD